MLLGAALPVWHQPCDTREALAQSQGSRDSAAKASSAFTSTETFTFTCSGASGSGNQGWSSSSAPAWLLAPAWDVAFSQ